MGAFRIALQDRARLGGEAGPDAYVGEVPGAGGERPVKDVRLGKAAAVVEPKA
jgi:hypothetical protein